MNLSFEDGKNLWKENPEFFRKVVKTEVIKYFLPLNLSINDILKVQKENPEFFNVIMQSPEILKYFPKVNLSFKGGKNLWKESPEFFKELTNYYFNQEKISQLQSLLTKRFPLEELQKLYKQDPIILFNNSINILSDAIPIEDFKNLIHNNSKLKINYSKLANILDTTFSWQEFKEIINKNPADANLFLSNNAFIARLSNYYEISKEEVKTLYQKDPNTMRLLLGNEEILTRLDKLINRPELAKLIKNDLAFITKDYLGTEI